MRHLNRVSGSRRAIRPALGRTRLLALATVLALPLSLNASQGILARAADAGPSQGAVGDADLSLTPEAARAGQYDDLPGVSRSTHEPRSVQVSSPKGTITWTASSLSDNGLPSAARRAYVSAAQAMAASDPACQLPWTLLAGVGRVESDHGRYGGSVLGADGVSHPLVIGVPLNGAGPVAAIQDTDNGRLDKDKVWDRAVGPMQFIPSTWAGAARDGDGDGVESPNDIDDAALAAAAYLCSGSGSVLGESAMSAAIFRYNASKDYVALVMAMEEGYRTGVFIMPASVVPDEPADRAKPKKHSGRKHAQRGDKKPHGSAGTSSASNSGGKPSDGPKPHPHPTGSPTGGGSGGTSPSPTPHPSPQPKPPPKPEPKPKTETKSGALAPCGSAWCLDGDPLDLRGVAGQQAGSDYDGDKVLETNLKELEGLSEGGPVSATVVVKFGTAVVTEIQSMGHP
jgi:membrane-bound lytic murein transglycosylase B